MYLQDDEYDEEEGKYEDEDEEANT